MAIHEWFVFDIGNTVIRLDYEKMLAGICADARVGRDELIPVLERMGGYRDLECGAVTFEEFHGFLADKIGYRAPVERLREVWGWVLASPTPGIDDLLDRVRREYRLAFLSNTNEVHAEQFLSRFGILFEESDRFVFSHRCGYLKPDPLMFREALRVLGALPSQVLFVDDLAENVFAAQDYGIHAYRFEGADALARTLESEGRLEPLPGTI